MEVAHSETVVINRPWWLNQTESNAGVQPVQLSNLVKPLSQNRAKKGVRVGVGLRAKALGPISSSGEKRRKIKKILPGKAKYLGIKYLKIGLWYEHH